MSMLSSQCERLRDRADNLRMLASGMDAPYIVPSTKETMALAMQSAASEMREAADTIESLGQKVEDLEGMLGELPPEGKCAMLLVKQVDGEYVWDCERYDFASYCLVDSEADTYTGMTLNDPFDRADFADKLTMAKELRKMAASLDAQGDILSIQTDSDAFGQKLSESRYSELFGTPERAARTMALMCECSPECSFCLLSGRAETICSNGDYNALLEWLRGDA